MRFLLAATAPALLVIACSRAPAPVAEAGSDDAVAAQCRAESRDSPEVRELWRQQLPSNVTMEDRLRAEARVAEANAFDACMRRRGARTGGGVERVRPAGWSW